MPYLSMVKEKWVHCFNMNNEELLNRVVHPFSHRSWDMEAYVSGT